jgi:hypothetical protein
MVGKEGILSEVYEGKTIETRSIRIEVARLDPAEPTHKFVTIIKTWGNNTKSIIDPMTPDEARFIRDVLVEIFRD